MSENYGFGAAALERKNEKMGFAGMAGLFPKDSIYHTAKRGFDFLSSLCAGLVLLPLIAVLTLIIFLKDPGNPFYVHKRIGKDGKELRMVKFRSMKKGAEQLEKMLTPEQLAEYKKEYKLEDDPRLIGWKKPGDNKKCFGAFIRRTSLDELPQIVWNILIKGNMSVVGPRPIVQEELQKNYTSQEQALLLSMKPGLTGYWQAYARNNAGYADGQRQSMELYYIHSASIGLDMKIVWQTIFTVLSRDGAG